MDSNKKERLNRTEPIPQGKETDVHYMPKEVAHFLGKMLRQPVQNLDSFFRKNRFLLGTSLFLNRQNSGKAKIVGWDKAERTIMDENINEEFVQNGNYLTIENKNLKTFGSEEGQSYDCIFVNPPFGYTDFGDEELRLENKFLSYALNNLKENGECIAVIPNGFLSRNFSQDISLRSALVQKYHLEKVILLPLSAFPMVEVYTSILVVKSDRRQDKKTAIYDLRDCPSLEKLCKYYEASNPLCVLDCDLLQKHNCILIPEEYHKRVKSDIEDIVDYHNNILLQLIALKKERLPVLHEEKNGQINFFISKTSLADKKRALKRMLALEYRLLDCKLAIFLRKSECKTVKGKELFALKNGGKYQKEQGHYLLYGAGGPHNTAIKTNMEETPSIIIGRVGACGNVYKAWSQGFVSDNAILVFPEREKVLLDFLLLLLHSANFKKFQRGTGQPYITHEKIYEEEFALPGLKAQAAFLTQIDCFLKEIKLFEQELERLEVV